MILLLLFVQLNYKVCWAKFTTRNESISFQSSTNGGSTKFIWVVHITSAICLSTSLALDFITMDVKCISGPTINEPNVLRTNRTLGFLVSKELGFFNSCLEIPFRCYQSILPVQLFELMFHAGCYMVPCKMVLYVPNVSRRK